MALICPCQTVAHSGRMLSWKTDNADSGATRLGKSEAGVLYSSSGSRNLKISVSKASHARGNSSDAFFLRQNRDGSQWHCQRRVSASISADRPIEVHSVRTSNGAGRTMAPTHEEKVGFDVEEGAEGASEAKESEQIPTNGSEATCTSPEPRSSSRHEKIGVLAPVKDESSQLSLAAEVQSSNNLQDKVLEQDEEFFDCDEEPYVSLVWKAGSEIERVLPENLRGLEKILGNVAELKEDLNAAEAKIFVYTDKLVTPTTMTEEKHARYTVEKIVSQLKTQVRQLREDMASKDELLGQLQVEASKSSDCLQNATESLSDAKKRILDLEMQLQAREEISYDERDKLFASVQLAGDLEQAAKVAEAKVAELTAELSSLRVLAAAGRKAEHLTVRIEVLEEELRSKDSILLEIKAETLRSTDALKLAAEIKQDLNSARQREVQLVQALESSNDLVKELQTDILENLRTLRAEQSLKQVEKMLWDARLEVDRLQKGVAERDKAIFAMKEEVDLNIGLLNSAARDRQNLHAARLQLEELKAELESKDAKLGIIREEMALVINLARQKQSNVSATSSPNWMAPPPAVPTPIQGSIPQSLKNSFQSRKQSGMKQNSGSTPQPM